MPAFYPAVPFRYISAIPHPYTRKHSIAVLTLFLQSVSALLTLGFGLAALAVAGRLRSHPPDRRVGWLLTGVGFSLLGAMSVLQDAWAVPAFFSGPGSAVYEGYLRWAPAGNHSRIFLGTAYALVMLVPAWRGDLSGEALRRYAIPAMLVAAALGGVLGWREGSFAMEVHGTAISLFLTVEMLAFALVLLVCAARGTFDVFLFACVMLYALKMALGVPLWTGMTLGQTLAGAISLPSVLKLQSVLFMSVMLAVAVLRLELLRRGLRVGEVFGRERVREIRFFGGRGARL